MTRGLSGCGFRKGDQFFGRNRHRGLADLLGQRLRLRLRKRELDACVRQCLAVERRESSAEKVIGQGVVFDAGIGDAGKQDVVEAHLRKFIVARGIAELPETLGQLGFAIEDKQRGDLGVTVDFVNAEVFLAEVPDDGLAEGTGELLDRGLDLRNGSPIFHEFLEIVKVDGISCEST